MIPFRRQHCKGRPPFVRTHVRLQHSPVGCESFATSYTRPSTSGRRSHRETDASRLRCRLNDCAADASGFLSRIASRAHAHSAAHRPIHPLPAPSVTYRCLRSRIPVERPRVALPVGGLPAELPLIAARTRNAHAARRTVRVPLGPIFDFEDAMQWAYQSR